MTPVNPILLTQCETLMSLKSRFVINIVESGSKAVSDISFFCFLCMKLFENALQLSVKETL